MIAGLTGTVTALEAAALVLDLHGVRLRVMTSTRTLAQVSLGEQISLETHLAVREDAMTLYGFPTAAELELFELLLTVTGIGPRVAMSAISFDQPDALATAIANEDVGLLSKIPGIGKKTAEQIVFQLRRKLPDFALAGAAAIDTTDQEAITALESLGYTTTEARTALASVEQREHLTIEERVFTALQRLAQG